MILACVLAAPPHIPVGNAGSILDSAIAPAVKNSGLLPPLAPKKSLRLKFKTPNKFLHQKSKKISFASPISEIRLLDDSGIRDLSPKAALDIPVSPIATSRSNPALKKSGLGRKSAVTFNGRDLPTSPLVSSKLKLKPILKRTDMPVAAAREMDQRYAFYESLDRAFRSAIRAEQKRRLGFALDVHDDHAAIMIKTLGDQLDLKYIHGFDNEEFLKKLLELNGFRPRTN